MKNSILIILLLTTLQSFAQLSGLPAVNDTLMSYTETVIVDNTDSKELFIRARDWLNNNCKAFKIQDKETGEISGECSVDGEVKVQFLGTHTGIATFDFVITFLVKDNYFKFIITNIRNTKINNTDANGVFGLLYNSGHCYATGLSLSRTKLDEAYQTLKDGFAKSEQQLGVMIKTNMSKTSAVHF